MNKRYFLLDISGVLITHPKWGSPKTNVELLQWLLEHKDKFSYALVTNNPPEIEGHIEAVYHIPKFYDHFISAQTYDLDKSDPKFYEDVLSVLLATPEQCLFVDDTPANLQAATGLGITGILYRNFGDFKKQLESL